MPVDSSGQTSARWVHLACTALSLALGALLAAAASGLGHRAGLWSFQAGFAILGLAALCALSGLVLGLICIARGQRVPRAARNMALAASVIGLVVAGLPARQLYLAITLPRIHDISTDTIDPPPFVAIAPLRAEAPNPAVYSGASVAQLQHAAYPNVVARSYTHGRRVVFDHALELVRSRGWTVHAADVREGRIEASATSSWFGFVDDVVIRVAESSRGTRVDMRSKSRVGLSDIGANAKRIEAFLGELDLKLSY